MRVNFAITNPNPSYPREEPSHFVTDDYDTPEAWDNSNCAECGRLSARIDPNLSQWRVLIYNGHRNDCRLCSPRCLGIFLARRDDRHTQAIAQSLKV